MRAWVMDDVEGRQRDPHVAEPLEELTEEQLADLGILHFVRSAIHAVCVCVRCVLFWLSKGTGKRVYAFNFTHDRVCARTRGVVVE